MPRAWTTRILFNGLVTAAVLLPGLSWAGPVGTVTAGGYAFSNFQGPGSGTGAGAGTNMNGIANGGAAVGFGIDNNGNFTNFVRNPDGTFTTINGLATGALANGINNAGDIVGVQNGQAFLIPHGGSVTPISIPGASSSAAFGINDKGNIVGQYGVGAQTPGFYLGSNSGTPVRIDAPAGADTVNVQGVNNSGQVVGFYVGNDGQDHGFQANIASAVKGQITGTAIGDPTLPTIPGEPGATFVFSQILGVNDKGIAVGYYGDSTTSQHGFLYNLSTGAYTFLDDPSEGFDNGVEVTQITGINNLGQITGFYSDSSGVFHGFVADPTAAAPEPGSIVLAGFGLLGLGFGCLRRRAAAARQA